VAAGRRRRAGGRDGRRVLTVGWSRTTVVVDQVGPILDLGSGAFPNAGADILCDGSLEDSRHRHGLAVVVDRPMVVARAEALPFRGGAFAYVIASHIAEHVEDPDGFCREIGRVGEAGYVETPSPLADRLFEEEYHLWRVDSQDGQLVFTGKTPKDRLQTRAAEVLYRSYNAGQSCARPTLGLPGGLLGRVFAFVLLVVRGILGRSGLLHTRHRFDGASPLRWRVVAANRPVVTFINLLPRSGFLESDRVALATRFKLREVTYPGSPTPRFAWQVARAAWRTDAVYGFFASEHMLLPGLAFRAVGKPVFVTVGGYDIAADREHGYGLARTGRLRWLPALVMRLADAVMPFSEAAEHELAASFPQAMAKARLVPLGVDGAAWEKPLEERPDRIGVVTVANVDEVSWSRKGIDRFVDLARADAKSRYVLAGRMDQSFAARLAPLPPNLEVTGHLTYDQLRELLWGCSVYAQLSWHEAFGVSLLEAMACGCLPLISEVPALVEVAGEWAVTVPAHSGERDRDGVRCALDRATEIDVHALRASVTERFDSAARTEALTDLIAEQLDPARR